jgi:hypothetical protein
MDSPTIYLKHKIIIPNPRRTRKKYRDQGSAAKGVGSGCNFVESFTVLAITAGWCKDMEVAGRASLRSEISACATWKPWSRIALLYLEFSSSRVPFVTCAVGGGGLGRENSQTHSLDIFREFKAVPLR